MNKLGAFMKNSFKRETRQNLAKSTFYVMILTFIGFVLGLVVQIMIAYYFGAGKEVDAFVVASIIPEFIYGVTNAILMTALIITLTKYLTKKGEDKTWGFASSIFNISFFILILISVLIFFLTPFLAKVLAPGFDKNRIELTIKLIRGLSLTIIFYGLSSFTTGLLYFKKNFVIPALFKILISISLIFFIFYLNQKLSIFSLVLGLIVGTFSGLGIQILFIFKEKVRDYPSLYLDITEIKRLICLSFPLMIISCFFYINKYITNAIASTLPIGNVAILNYAFLIVSFPASFFGISLATVIFPSLAEYHVQKNQEKFRILFLKSLRILIFILVPISMLLIVTKNLLVKLIFQHGVFQYAETNATSLALLFYTFGLVAFGLNSLISQTFYALAKIKIRAILSLLIFVLNILLSFLFVRYFGYVALAIAASVAFLTIESLSLYTLHKYLKLNFNRFIFYCTKILISVLIAGIITFGTYLVLVSVFWTEQAIVLIFNLIFIWAVGFISYLTLTILFGLNEIRSSFNLLKNIRKVD